MKKNTGFAIEEKPFNAVKKQLKTTPFTMNKLVDTFIQRCEEKEYLNNFIKDNFFAK